MVLVAVPKPLREKLGDEGTDALVTLINQSGNGYKIKIVDLVEGRFERRLSEEMVTLRQSMGGLDRRMIEEASTLDRRITEEISKLDLRITEEISKLDLRISAEVSKLDLRITEEASKLDVKLSETKADLLRWMFIFWIGQVGALLGILFAFFRR
jgi:bifunctional DNA-binding transcriptional regulator/antitoxin component of YhaV-PrlF toxin-antitoxin module